MSNPEFSDPNQSQCDISTAPPIIFIINPEIHYSHPHPHPHHHHHHHHPQLVQEKEQKTEPVKSNNEEAVICGGVVSTTTDRVKTTLSTCELSKVVVDDDEGFKTPTSLDQRILEIRPCPPRPCRKKRRKLWRSHESGRRRVLLDLSEEVESMFPPRIRANFGHNITRPRSC